MKKQKAIVMGVDDKYVKKDWISVKTCVGISQVKGKNGFKKICKATIPSVEISGPNRKAIIEKVVELWNVLFDETEKNLEECKKQKKAKKSN